MSVLFVLIKCKFQLLGFWNYCCNFTVYANLAVYAGVAAGISYMYKRRTYSHINAQPKPLGLKTLNFVQRKDFPKFNP